MVQAFNVIQQLRFAKTAIVIQWDPWVLENNIIRLQDEMNKQKINMEHLAQQLLNQQKDKSKEDPQKGKNKEDTLSPKKFVENKNKVIFDTINV